MGASLVASGRPARALPLLERALRIRERAEPRPLPVAEVRTALAHALWDARQDEARAQRLAAAALERAWLAGRR